MQDLKENRILDNKLLFILFLHEKGFYENTPILYKVHSKGITTEQDKVSFPCILKRPISRGGEGSRIINNVMEEITIIDETDYYLQEYIHGETEYASHFYVRNGNIEYSVTFEAKYKGIYIKRGNIKNYKPTHIDISLFNKIFSILYYTGFACANFKIIDGVIKLFEINPRMGGSIYCTNYYLDMMIKSNETIR